MYSPTARLRPHFSSYSLDTGLGWTCISSNPAKRMMRSSSSTEEAPLTQQEYRAASSFIWAVSSFMMTMSQMDTLPPGFSARKISR